MRKKLIISIILFSSLTSWAQLYHIIEIEGGISGSAHVKSVASSSFNLDYILNYKVFLFKASYGFSPRTDFGVRTGTSLTIGFTSPIEKVFSFHLWNWQNVGKQKYLYCRIR